MMHSSASERRYMAGSVGGGRWRRTKKKAKMTKKVKMKKVKMTKVKMTKATMQIFIISASHAMHSLLV